MITSIPVDSPKRAVLINPFNSKLVCPLPTQSYASVISYNDKIQIKTESSSLHKKGRKRSLDHLTYEEKLQRKKLKNREAAQTSRDRKKARMEELEKTVKYLEKTCKELRNKCEILTAQNEKVHKEKEELQKENERLKESSRCGCTLESTSGSAESLVNPLPQGHSSHPAQTSLLIPSVFLKLMICLRISILIQIGTRILTIYFKIYHHYRSRPLQRIAKLTPAKWWGRHQHSWNPVDWNYLLPIAIN